MSHILIGVWQRINKITARSLSSIFFSHYMLTFQNDLKSLRFTSKSFLVSILKLNKFFKRWILISKVLVRKKESSAVYKALEVLASSTCPMQDYRTICNLIHFFNFSWFCFHFIRKCCMIFKGFCTLC